MDPVQIHLAINHFPVFAVLFGLGLLAYAILARRPETLRVGLFLLVLSGLAALPTSLSGERAEEVVEEKPGAAEAVIHRHEDAAKAAAWGVYALAAAALVGLLAFRSRPMPGWFKGLALAGALAVSGLMVWTAGQGGKIAHEELRGPASPADRAGEAQGAEPREGREHEDGG